MAIPLTTALQNALNDPERYGILFFTFEMGSGTYGLMTGQGELLYNGIVYRAGGSLLDVSDLQQNADGSVAEFTLSLSTAPDKGLTTDILLTFYSEDWHMREIVLQLGMMNPDTGQPIGLATLFNGYMYQAPFNQSEDKATISLRCVSQTIKMSEQGNKYRNDSTQKRLDPTDTSLVDIGLLGGSVKKDLRWGQA